MTDPGLSPLFEPYLRYGRISPDPVEVGRASAHGEARSAEHRPYRSQPAQQVPLPLGLEPAPEPATAAPAASPANRTATGLPANRTAGFVAGFAAGRVTREPEPPQRPPVWRAVGARNLRTESTPLRCFVTGADRAAPANGAAPAEPVRPATWQEAFPDANAPVPVERWLKWVESRTGLNFVNELRDPERLCAMIRERLPRAQIEWVLLENGNAVVRVGKFTCVLPRNLLRRAS